MNDFIASITQEYAQKGFLLEKVWNSYSSMAIAMICELDKIRYNTEKVLF